MNALHFLVSRSISTRIGKLAVIVQTILTLVIVVVLLLPAYKRFLPLLWYVDILFIIFHLMYRLLYRGTKVILSKKLRGLLITHSFTAILSLFLTYMNIDGQTTSSVPAAISWIATLILGCIFFVKKYYIGIILEERL